MRGIGHLRNAKARLAHANGDAREHLQTAAREFWRAAFDRAEWPLRVQADAEAIQNRLLSNGVIRETIDQMSDHEVQQTMKELLSFCTEAERAAERTQGVKAVHVPDSEPA